MTYYSVLEVTPRNDHWIPDYLPAANALVAKHGGKYLARTATHETIEGVETKTALRIIIEWPSRDHAIAFENDPDYTPHLDARLSNSESHHVLIEGKDDMA
ncbi:MAG: DUF1330 domain-containing protein [Pseudomonadota bacterium]